MPNNKGYIYNGLYCYGDLPPEPNMNLVLFEKNKNNILYIHEWSETEYKIFKKIGKNKKTFVSSKMIKQNILC